MPPVDIGIWDVVLVAAVSLQTLCLTYVFNPRWKAVFFTLPIPFTIVSLAVGRPVGVTHASGFLPLLAFVGVVMLLYARRVPIVAAIAAADLTFILIGVTLNRLLPDTPLAFWLVASGMLVLGGALVVLMPPRSQAGHRTPLPVWQKLPIIVAVVIGLILIKRQLGGFAALFPMVSTVAAYEARRCLYTLARQLPILMLSLTPMMMVCRLTQQSLGLLPGLACGWIAFLAVYLSLTAARWRREDRALPDAPPLRAQ